jgi:hypothetical protein
VALSKIEAVLGVDQRASWLSRWIGHVIVARGVKGR